MDTKKDYIAPLLYVIDLKADGLMDATIPGGGASNPTEAESKPGDIGFDDDEAVDNNIWDDEPEYETY